MRIFGKELGFRRKSFATRPGVPMFSTEAITGGYEGGFFAPASEAQKSSIVASCLRIITAAYTEAPIKGIALDGTELDKPSLAESFMARPCHGVDGFAQVTGRWFWQSRVRAGLFSGNFYAIKLRNASGALIGLWPCLPDTVTPETNKTGTDLLGVRVSLGGEIKPFKREDIVHIRNGQDRSVPCLGRGPIQDLAAIISADNSAVRFISDLAKLPVLRMLITYGGIDAPSAEQADMIRANLMDRSKLNMAVLPKDSKVEKVGLNPQEAGVETMTDLPEERICAVLGVPLIMAQLGAGMGATTYNNLKEAREQFVQGTIVPMWQDDAEQLAGQLVGEFERPVRTTLVFDESKIKALQEDISEAHDRARKNFQAGGITLNEFRDQVQMPAVDTFGEMYAWELSLGGPSVADAAIKQFALQGKILGNSSRSE